MIQISDIKQYIYCPRIIYYQHCLLIDKKDTYKMESGTSKHSIEELLESRRNLKSFDLYKGKKDFEVYLKSKNLSGRLDLLITVQKDGEKSYYPVDYKNTTSVHNNHILQIVGYSLIIDEIYETIVNVGFIYLIPLKKVKKIEISKDLKEECSIIINKIENIISSYRLPEQTEQRSKCTNCEYNRFCDDIW